MRSVLRPRDILFNDVYYRDTCNVHKEWNIGEDEISFATAKQSAKQENETEENDRTQK